MKRFATFAGCAAAVALCFSLSTAQARPHRKPVRHASVPMARVAAPAPFVDTTPAGRARSGWIDGASPYNPEGSSNPQTPNSN